MNTYQQEELLDYLQYNHTIVLVQEEMEIMEIMEQIEQQEVADKEVLL